MDTIQLEQANASTSHRHRVGRAGDGRPATPRLVIKSRFHLWLAIVLLQCSIAA